MINLILGQQSGHTKFPCFLCEWDSRARNQHYVKKQWLLRQTMKAGDKNVIHDSQVDRSRILFPPLHIKLGVMKQFVRALKQRESEAFKYLSRTFPKHSQSKIDAGIFDGPQIRKLINDEKFFEKMNSDEEKAWKSFVEVCTKFLGNVKDPNYKNIVKKMICDFRDIGCLMNVKLHYLDSHLDRFPDNVGDYSEEQGERFHQDIKLLEKGHQGFWDVRFLSDYCWMIKRETYTINKRKVLTRTFEERCRPKN